MRAERARVHAQDRLAPSAVGRLHSDAPVEAAGPEQRLVEHVGPVRRRDHDHAGRRVEPVHLREDLVQRLLALVVAAAEAGDTGGARAADRVELVDEDDRGCGLLRLANRSRTRDAPTPTIASTNSDAAIEKNGTFASPATARASSVLPVPGGPESSTPCGIRPPRRRYLSGFRRKSTTSRQLLLRLVDAGDVGEGHAIGRRLIATTF